MKDFLLAVDQLLNTLVYSSDDGAFGKADEALSARCWRLRNSSTFWYRGWKVVDFIFFWDADHCYQSYKSEVMHRQLPNEYYADALDLYLNNFTEDSLDADIDVFLKSIS